MRGQFPTTPRGRWIVLLVVMAVAAAACASSGASAPEGAGTTVDTSQKFSSNGGGVPRVPAGATAGPAQPAPLGAPGSSDLLVIKTGSMALQVKALEASLADATAKIAGLGGYVSGSQRGGDGQNSVANVTFRIPAAHWDEALVALRGLAEKVVDEQTQSQEVTGQVIDLGARIDNLQATERSLQAIMAKAIKISDVLDVQAQLTDVRGQIEQLETEKKHLEEQSAFGTLTVSFGLETAAVVQAQKGWDPAGEADRATASLVELGQSLAGAGIWFGIFWLPLLILLVLIVAIVLVVVRRIRRRWPAGPSKPAHPGWPTVADGSDGGPGSEPGLPPAEA